MGSAHYVNYSIRPNKTVERKLVFQTLEALAPIYDFTRYKYIGLGALWFVDFVLAHKRLSIADMISIEKNEYLANRAKFNRPYGCVSVEHGESVSVLPRLPFEEKPLLVWLDYDKSLDGPVLEDLATLSQRALTDSLMIVTINADKRSLPDKDADNLAFESDETMLRYYAGDLVPQTLPAGAMQGSKYPSFLASLLFQHIRRQVRRAGREDDVVVPLFNIKYQDNAPMLTIGVAIVDPQRAEETAVAVSDGIMVKRMDERNQLSIDVPPLTLKEKVTLDQLMPCKTAPSEKEVSRLGFRLKPSQIESYHRFYRHYPVFGEIAH